MMTYNEREKIYEQAMDAWGADVNFTIAIEEMAELTELLCKLKRGRNVDLHALTDELADVCIMVEQVIHIFDLALEVSERMEFKLNRLEERVRKARTEPASQEAKT